MIDLRSDTVTNPTLKMREAMFNAAVGDEVYGDDPTMIELEELATQMLEKESALFIPSGTMGNQLAIMTHVGRGDEIILGSEYHIMAHEVGAAAALSGAFMHSIEFDGGIPEPIKIFASIRDKDNVHYPTTGLICMENPLANGKLVSIDIMKEIYEIAKDAGIPIHLDGARLFNGALALGVEAKEISRYCDTVMICLSKGLCAPIGSMLLGNKKFIDKARKNRKLMGGGMRQTGFLAAAGIIALKDMTKRLHEDHENAKLMAQEMKKIPQVYLDIDSVQINMVFFMIDAKKAIVDTLPERMYKRGFKINPIEAGEFRFVTTNDIKREDVIAAVEALRDSILEIV